MLNVVMVQVGNYLGRGQEYVLKLQERLRLALTIPHRTYLITDEPASLYPGLICKPAVYASWWEKLRIFKPGMFKEGMALFLDLDTIIVGNIDFLGDYKGQFAIPHDFWRPEGLGPGVMLFDPEWAEFIYQEWAAAGFPQTDPRGDQGWMENLHQGRMRKEVDIMQKLWPGAFVSYKTSAVNSVPDDCKVVCFHGRPRPHEAGGWVKEVWNG